MIIILSIAIIVVGLMSLFGLLVLNDKIDENKIEQEIERLENSVKTFVEENSFEKEIKESLRLLEHYLEVEKREVDIMTGYLWGIPYFERELRYVKKKNGKIELEITAKKVKKLDKKIKK